jgi:3-oxoacyl-[acyl-carrier protein] reductase
MTLRKILITGASRGIGKAIALHLANFGMYHLILHGSSRQNLDRLVTLIPGKCKYEMMPCNFTDNAATDQFIKEIKARHHDLYGVVSNAGISRDKALAYQPVTEIDELLTVNLRVPILLAKASMKLFSKNGAGVFIAMSSCVAEMGNAFQSVYAATKAANTALCKSLAREAGILNGGQRIRFVSIAPGFIETEMTDGLSEEIKERYLRQIPAGRFGEVDDVARAVQFLLSEEASYINGGEFKINGGLI